MLRSDHLEVISVIRDLASRPGCSRHLDGQVLPRPSTHVVLIDFQNEITWQSQDAIAGELNSLGILPPREEMGFLFPRVMQEFCERISLLVKSGNLLYNYTTDRKNLQ